MKILLLGKNGQVGWELQRSLAPLGDLVALDRDGGEGLCGDLADVDGLIRTVRQLRPALIVNAAAYTAVDKAESEPERAHAINAVAVAALAGEAVALGALLLHYSTDYVFDGTGSLPRSEDEPTGPLNVYGQSKLQGEQAIISSGCRHLILRTSWVYAARGGNFAKTMLRLAADREQLSVIDDQFGAPTGAELIADVSAHAARATLADAKLAGLYHLAAGGTTNWHQYASHVIARAREMGLELKVQNIAAIPSSAYPTPARRPANSRLATGKLEQVFGLRLPDWRQGVDRMLNELAH